jgi:hypothetical protein
MSCRYLTFNDDTPDEEKIEFEDLSRKVPVKKIEYYFLGNNHYFHYINDKLFHSGIFMSDIETFIIDILEFCDGSFMKTIEKSQCPKEVQDFLHMV